MLKKNRIWNQSRWSGRSPGGWGVNYQIRHYECSRASRLVFKLKSCKCGSKSQTVFRAMFVLGASRELNLPRQTLTARDLLAHSLCLSLSRQKQQFLGPGSALFSFMLRKRISLRVCVHSRELWGEPPGRPPRTMQTDTSRAAGTCLQIWTMTF